MKKKKILSKAEKKVLAVKKMASGRRTLPLDLFEVHHPELVLTDSVLRVSPLGLRYRAGKFLQFKDTVDNFAEELDRLCGYNESCLDKESQDFADYCLFNSKPCVLKSAQKKVLKKYQDAEKKEKIEDNYSEEYYLEKLNELEKKNLLEEIPF